MKKLIIFFLVVVVLISGAIIFWPKENVVAPVKDNKSSQDVLSYKDATYEIDQQKVTLTNGASEEKIPDSLSTVDTAYFGNEVKGDFNGDGKEDVAFVLIQHGGGTGTFYFLAVALKTDKGYRGINTIFLGDRIAPQTTEFKNGVIAVNYADRLPSEDFSVKPSVGVSRYFKIENDSLVEMKGEMGDSTSLNTEPVACTMEAKMCPDGSFVGRSGPKCEFAKCPGEK